MSRLWKGALKQILFAGVLGSATIGGAQDVSPGAQDMSPGAQYVSPGAQDAKTLGDRKSVDFGGLIALPPVEMPPVEMRGERVASGKPETVGIAELLEASGASAASKRVADFEPATGNGPAEVGGPVAADPMVVTASGGVSSEFVATAEGGEANEPELSWFSEIWSGESRPIRLASFAQSAMPLNSGSPGGIGAGLFSLGPPNLGSQLTNNFTALPDFDTGIVIQGDKAALKVGGYVKADLIQDFDAIESTDSFATNSILTDGSAWQNTRFHARQSRLSFDTRWLNRGNVVRALVEADFFGLGAGGSSDLRLRHAYGTLGRLTVGQTWTTFTDPAAVPQTLDFEGAVSNVNRRQGQVRWTQPIWVDGLSLAMALENPQIILQLPPGIQGEGRTQTPDFIARLRYEQSWGEFQAAYLLRELAFQPVGQPVDAGTAYGFNFTGSVLLDSKSKVYSQITFGEGIGSYRGSPDVVATGPTTAAILPVFGWMIGVKREWTDRLTSNFTYSELSLDNVAGQDAADLSHTSYLAANLIANPYERVFVGMEYLHGVREDVGGARGSANRLQFSFGFYLP